MKKWTEAKITELSIEMTESGLIDGYDEFWIIVNDDKKKKKNNPVTPNPYPVTPVTPAEPENPSNPADSEIDELS